jgi:hypothetical protein
LENAEYLENKEHEVNEEDLAKGHLASRSETRASTLA